MLRTLKWLFYVLLLAAIFGAGYYFFADQGKKLGATLTVTVGDFREQVSVSGTVTATQNVELGFAANGRISGTFAKVGQFVDAGTVLAETENGDLAASLSQKQSALDEAKANLAALEVGTRPEEVAVASTAVTNATSALVNAVQNAYTTSDDAIHNRVDSLLINPRTDPKLSFTVSNATLVTALEKDRTAIEPVLVSFARLARNITNDTAVDSANQAGTYLGEIASLLAEANSVLNQGIADQSTSATTLTSYSNALATARVNVNDAATTLSGDISALGAAKSNLSLKQAGSTSETLAAQEATVAAAEADIRSAQATLSKTRVVAPFAGTVTRMDAKVGEIVSPNTSEISLQSNGVFQIETFVPEVTIARIVPGNPATSTLDAYGSSTTFPAKVVAVDPAETIKDGVPTYKTTLSFLRNDPRIRSGMTANVVMETGVLKDAIVIPAGAVAVKDGVSYVSIVENSMSVNHTVTTGPSPALGQAHILSGLSAGDVILLTPVP
jgi:RND family efflux transporter MFP subunit